MSCSHQRSNKQKTRASNTSVFLKKKPNKNQQQPKNWKIAKGLTISSLKFRLDWISSWLFVSAMYRRTKPIILGLLSPTKDVCNISLTCKSSTRPNAQCCCSSICCNSMLFHFKIQRTVPGITWSVGSNWVTYSQSWHSESHSLFSASSFTRPTTC